MNVCVCLTCICWSPNPSVMVFGVGTCGVMLVRLCSYGISVLYKKSGHLSTQGGSCLQAKRKSLRMELTLPSPWVWTSYSPKLWEINCCGQSHQPMVFRYGSPGWPGLRHRKWGKSRNQECRWGKERRESQRGGRPALFFLSHRRRLSMMWFISWPEIAIEKKDWVSFRLFAKLIANLTVS